MPSASHIANCFLLLTLIFLIQYGSIRYHNSSDLNWTWKENDLSNEMYVVSSFAIVLTTISVLGRLVIVIVGFMGLLIHDCFPGTVKLRANMAKLPLISFRVVTRGNYPDLINANVEFNKNQCLAVGLRNFVIEIVTEKRMDLLEDSMVKQIVVPQSYSTKRGTLFKGRNLQYCLEEGVSGLREDDWILHLDEDSLLTENAVIGLANFIHEGKHCMGNGFISFDHQNITSLQVKIISGYRHFYQLGFLRMINTLFDVFPLLTPGSFVACKVRTEKELSFDGGPTASIMEFFYLTLTGYLKGYGVGWIEGEVREMGPLTVREAIDQNARVFNGSIRILQNKDIRGMSSILVIIFCCFQLAQPIHLLTMVLSLILRNNYLGHPLLVCQGLFIANDIYQGILALYKYRNISVYKFLFLAIANLVLAPIYFPLIFSISVCKGMLQRGFQFKVTKKAI